MSVCCSKDFPKKPIPGIGQSFHDMYQDLLTLTQQILCVPVMKKIFEEPYALTREEVNQVDRVVGYYGNIFCNDRRNIPDTVYKRFLATTNDGLVWVDVSTFVPPLLFNYTTYRLLISSNVYELTSPQTEPLFNDFFEQPSSVISNPNEISISNIQEKLQYGPSQTVVLKIGLDQEPYTAQDIHIDPHNPPPYRGEGVSYTIIQNHQTRIEIQQAFLEGCGYSSRYSDTNFSYNYHVALRIRSERFVGYSVVFRFSYFLI
jgi:hypothetical protein